MSAPTAAPPTGFRVAPRLNVDQTAYPDLSLVAGERDGRVLVGPQGGVPCGDWRMNANVRGTAIDVLGFRGPPKDAACYGSPAYRWRPVGVADGSSRIAVTYRGATGTYGVVVDDRKVRVSRISGSDVARLSGTGGWWVLPADFLYADAHDAAGSEGGGERACVRIDELVRDFGGRSHATPDGLPLPRLASSSQPPGKRAEAAAKMLSIPPSHGCNRTYVFRASEADLHRIANDASCEGALVSLVRDIPDGHAVTSEEESPGVPDCTPAETAEPLLPR